MDGIQNLPGGEGRGGAARRDPRDVAQLQESPVSVRRVARLFAPYTRRIALVVVLIVATSVVGLAQPFLVRAVVDDALPHQDLRLLVMLVVAMLASAAATQMIGVVQTWQSTAVGQRVMHDLRSAVFRHLQRQSLAFFTRTRSGEIQSRLTGDISAMQSVVTTAATSVASNFTAAVATAIAMVALSWRLSLLSLVVIPPAVWLMRRVALMRRDITARRQRVLSDLHSQVEQGLSVSGIRLSKTLGTSQANAARFDDTSAELVGLELRSQLAGRWRMATMQIIFAAIPALVYLMAGLPATSGGMTIGTLIAFTGLQAAIFRPLLGLLNVGAQWIASMALFSRIFGYLNLTPEVPAPANPVRLDNVRGEVCFESVGVTYPDADSPALQDVSLTVPAGHKLGVAGSTGSGKSTLGALLPRLLDPTHGRVLIDGVDVRDIDPAQLAEIVAVVSQETYLVHDTIRANLWLAKPSATEEELWKALAVAQVDSLVATLPEGLDTMVGSRGFRFSGGEQQRLAIARTVLRDPAVLILDEATSALDVGTEAEVQAALDALSAGRTTITIAHRLSTLRSSDQVAVLEHGRLVGLDAPQRSAAMAAA